MTRDTAAPETDRPEISIVVPFHNEEQNLEPLLDEINCALEKVGRSYEILCVDDGSTDDTPYLLNARAERDDRIRVLRLSRNFGQTAALAAGFDNALGEIIISMDGDGQHNPAEIPLFLDKLSEGHDVVSGWRKTRPEGLLTRRIPSRIANGLMARLSGIPIHDFGTTFKAYRREVLEQIDLYGDFHRFIPALAHEAGARVVELPINVRARTLGQSHYGLWRAFTVFFDLIRLRFLSAYLARPLQIFGSAGLFVASLGGAVAAVLIYLRLFHAYPLGDRWPMFTISIFSMLLGAQLFGLGLLSEIVVRLYFGLGVKKPYVIARNPRPPGPRPGQAGS